MTKFVLQNIIISKSTLMYGVLDKDIIKSEIVPYLPLAKTCLLRRVSDLKRICGSESYDNGLEVYRIYEAATMAGIPGAKESYEKLKQRFYGQGNPGRPASNNQ